MLIFSQHTHQAAATGNALQTHIFDFRPRIWVGGAFRDLTLYFRGAGDVVASSLPAATPGGSCAFCRVPFPLHLSASANNTAMNKKKKPFLGMPAPLGYVPGLGRG